MLSSYLSLALYSLLATASPLSKRELIDQTGWVYFKGSSVNPNLELFNLPDYSHGTKPLGI